MNSNDSAIFDSEKQLSESKKKLQDLMVIYYETKRQRDYLDAIVRNDPNWQDFQRLVKENGELTEENQKLREMLGLKQRGTH